MILKFQKIIFFFLVFITPIFAFGQNINTPYALTGELGVKIIPSYPKANQDVSINLTLYTADLNTADITWYKNRQMVLSGKGETRYSFKTGTAGEQDDIEIRIRLIDGTSFSKSFSLTPADVELVWEATSYVPPFYAGKALHPRQGILKIVAVPEFIKNGRIIPASQLVYNWSNNGTGYPEKSGYGKNVLILLGSAVGRSEKISVLVTDPVSKLTAQSFLDINPVDPEILFYENNAYYGHIFDYAIPQNFQLKSEEINLLAAPYYFSKEASGGLEYNWSLNGSSVSDLKDSRMAIFRKPEDKTGQSSISLQISNIKKVLQFDDSKVIMMFEK